MSRVITLLLASSLLTACTFEELLGGDPGAEAYSTAQGSTIEASCVTGAPAWTTDRELYANDPRICDDMVDAFPRIEVDGTDGTLKISLRKLARGGFPSLTGLAYHPRSGYGPIQEYECKLQAEEGDRSITVCKPGGDTPVTSTRQDPTQVELEPYLVRLTNPFCGNTVIFERWSSGIMACRLKETAKPLPCPSENAPLGACENSHAGPPLFQLPR